MDYSKIRLANERNSHVTKRLNRLSTWKFFKVIYRENIWRMFGYNFLMLICVLPIWVVMMMSDFALSNILNTLPTLNGLGFSTGAWWGSTGSFASVADYINFQTRQTQTFYGGMAVLAAMLMTLVFSGGFAVIRDAFWTGKLSTVGVFRSMWKGIKANIGYAFITAAIVALSVFGIWNFYVWFKDIVFWLAIVLTVLLAIVALFVLMYLMILCSVTVTYKQKIGENLDDAWRLLWLNVLPNLVHMVVALIPVGLYFLFSNSFLQQIYLIVMLMFGGLYFPLVWQTHMMKTFALFHPVEVRKKKKQSKSAADGSEKKVSGKDLPAADSDEDVQSDEADSEPVVAEEIAESEPVTEAENAENDVGEEEAEGERDNSEPEE